MAAANPKAQDAFDPASVLELKDIALWSTSLVRGETDYIPSKHLSSATWQTMRGVQPEVLTVAFEDGEEADVLRVHVSLGVRLLELVEPEGGEGVKREENVLFTLEAVFAVSYQCKAGAALPSQDQFNDFVNFNCVHNAWPFWRQHVYDTLKRASLPVPEVPFFPGRPSR